MENGDFDIEDLNKMLTIVGVVLVGQFKFLLMVLVGQHPVDLNYGDIHQI